MLRFVDIAVDALAEAREEIDALNVYPVPDGDTGTNMYLTVRAPPATPMRDAERRRRPDGRPAHRAGGLRAAARCSAPAATPA